MQFEREVPSVDVTVLPYLNEEKCISCITLLENCKFKVVPVCLEICRNKFCPDRNNIKTHYNNSNHNNHDDSITFFKCFFFPDYNNKSQLWDRVQQSQNVLRKTLERKRWLLQGRTPNRLSRWRKHSGSNLSLKLTLLKKK